MITFPAPADGSLHALSNWRQRAGQWNSAEHFLSSTADLAT